jgi:hypothetical protein
VSVYGPFVTSLDIEQAIRTLLQTWLDTYLGELERRSQRPLRSLPRPRTWFVVTDVEDILQWPDRDLPAVLVESTGDGDTEPAGRRLNQWMRFTVTLVYRGSGKRVDRETDREVIVLLASAIKWVLWKHRTLGGAAEALRIDRTGYDFAPPARPNTLAGAEIDVAVLVADVVELSGGPTLPDDPPPVDLPPDSPGDPPVVETTSVTLVAEPPTP